MEEKEERIEKYNKGVDNFAKAMKFRFAQKLDQGFSGWDGGYPVESMKWRMFNKVSYIIQHIKGNPSKYCVDIANFAMMIRYRYINRGK